MLLNEIDLKNEKTPGLKVLFELSSDNCLETVSWESADGRRYRSNWDGQVSWGVIPNEVTSIKSLSNYVKELHDKECVIGSGASCENEVTMGVWVIDRPAFEQGERGLDQLGLVVSYSPGDGDIGVAEYGLGECATNRSLLKVADELNLEQFVEIAELYETFILDTMPGNSKPDNWKEIVGGVAELIKTVM